MKDFAEQGSEAWLEQRVGMVTASRVSDVLAKGKGGAPSRTRANYKAELIAEILTGARAEQEFTNKAMEWGNEQEAAAVAQYCFMHDAEATECGFIQHPTIERAGASPDRLIGDDGLIEMKCPNTATHIDTMLSNTQTIAKGYRDQMQMQMAATGRKWCDFVSYDPRLPARFQLWVQRVERDDEYIAEMNEAIVAFLAEIDETIAGMEAKVT